VKTFYKDLFIKKNENDKNENCVEKTYSLKNKIEIPEKVKKNTKFIFELNDNFGI
jgi:hypothetical protein